MSEPMVTRAELKGLDMQARWMLVSGERVDLGRIEAHKVRDGIQLYVSTPDGRSVRVDLEDVHDAGELYAALEAHMENVTEAAPITPEERERLLRKGRPPRWDEIRRRNLKAIQEEIDHPLRPRLVKADGEEYTGPRVIVPSDEYQDLLAAKRDAVDPEFLEAMDDVVQAWTNNGPHARVDHARRVADVREAFPGLAGLLDRLAALNA